MNNIEENNNKTIYVIARCEACSFKRYSVSIKNEHFNNNAGYQTLQHLIKHQDHTITLNGKRYKLSKTIYSLIPISD